MDEAKDAKIIMRVSPELKKAIRVAAASENRKMSNFILTTLLEHPKVKKALNQPIENEEEITVEQGKQSKIEEQIIIKKQKEKSIEEVRHRF